MKTICLRFNDALAPEKGTIALHEELITKCGYVCYGKKGCKISNKILDELLKNGPVDILLIKSGTQENTGLL